MGEDFSEITDHLKTYDHEMILGQMAWYSVPEITVSHSDFIVKMHERGLDNIFLPPHPRPADVFRRACNVGKKDQQTFKDQTTGEMLTHNYMIREVGKDADSIWRQLVRETVDSKDHQLEYKIVGELLFDRRLETITFEDLGVPKEPASAWETAIWERIQSTYVSLLDQLTAYAVRQVIVKVLQSFSATVVRPSGGVYFVAEFYYDELRHLEDLINSIEGCSFHTLPLLDDTKQRGMLKKAFEDESIELVDRSLEEIRKIFAEGKLISSEKYSGFFEDYKVLIGRTKEYADLLEENMDTTSARLEVYQEQIFHLLERVK